MDISNTASTRRVVRGQFIFTLQHASYDKSDIIAVIKYGSQIHKSYLLVYGSLKAGLHNHTK